MAEYINGVDKIEVGPIGTNGTPGASLTRITPIADGSVTYTEPDPTFTDIFAEDVNGAIFRIPGNTEAPTFVFQSLDLAGATRVLLMGGTYNDTTKTYSQTDQTFTTYQTVKLTSKPASDGTRKEYTFPYCQLVARETGQIGRANLSTITVTCSVLVPVNASGVPQPFKIVKTLAAV